MVRKQDYYLTSDEARLLTRQVASAADLYARIVETETDFAHWKLDFELWRDTTWGLVEQFLGNTVVDLYKSIGRVDVDKDDEHGDLKWRPFNDAHRVLLAILQTYLERIRAIVEVY